MRGCAEGMRATLTGGTRVVSGPRVESSTKGDTLFPVRAPRESSRVEYCEG